MSLKEKAKDLFDSAKEPAIEMSCELFLEGVAGTVVPGVVTSYLAYKQKRQERMYEEFMIETKQRVRFLEDRLRNLTEEQYKNFKDNYFGLVSDYVFEEVQQEKIKYLVNGLINIAEIPNVNEDFVLTYYDVLKELRVRDIGVLKFYYESQSTILERENYIDVLEELEIEYEQYNAIREKLLRLGMFTTKRDKKIDGLYKNILNMQDFLENVSKGKKTKLKRFEKIDKRDSFELSKFGKTFVDFFINEVE